VFENASFVCFVAGSMYMFGDRWLYNFSKKEEFLDMCVVCICSFEWDGVVRGYDGGGGQGVYFP